MVVAALAFRPRVARHTNTFNISSMNRTTGPE